MSVLSLIRPDTLHDNAAQTLANWAQETLNDIKARTPNHSLHKDLRGSSNASRTNVEQALSASDALFFYGHGSWEKLLDGSTALLDKQNISRAKDKFVVAVACKSAHTLGPEAIRNGVKGYLGFDEDFGWPTGIQLNLFEIAAVRAAKELILNGGSLAQALKATKDAFQDAVQYFKYGPGAQSPNAVRAWLWADWDKNHVLALGNSAASL